MNKDEECIFEKLERFYGDDEKRQRKMFWYSLVITFLIIVMLAVCGYYLRLNHCCWF